MNLVAGLQALIARDQEATSPLEEYRMGLVHGRLRLCGNCKHFSAAEETDQPGHCAVDDCETWTALAFLCSKWSAARAPVLPEYLPERSR